MATEDLDKILDSSTPNDINIANEKKELFGDEKRGESVKTNLHYIVIGFIYLIALCFASMLVVRTWDFIMPDCRRILSERGDHELERIIFSGIIVSFATKYFKKFNIIEN